MREPVQEAIREPAQEQGDRRRKSAAGVMGQRLAVNQSALNFEKYAYRWINDSPARMHSKTKEDDWDVVMNVGVKEDSADLGNAVRQVVGTNKDGSPLYAYLCRKPRSYFDQDQKDKHAELDRQLAELRRGNDASGAAQSDYVPASGIRL